MDGAMLFCPLFHHKSEIELLYLYVMCKKRSTLHQRNFQCTVCNEWIFNFVHKTWKNTIKWKEATPRCSLLFLVL